MKTLNDLQYDLTRETQSLRDIRDYNFGLNAGEKTKSEGSTNRIIKMIRKAILYMECDPTEDSANRQLIEVNVRLNRIEQGFLPWFEDLQLMGKIKKEQKPVYNKLSEKPKFNSEKRFLEYVLC